MSQGQPPRRDPYRRRDERLEFVASCFLTVTSPAWAMTREPIPASTQNITLNGVKVTTRGFPTDRASKWVEAMENFERISVTVGIHDGESTTSIPGELVWANAEPSGVRGECFLSAGVLFGVLRAQDERALRALMDRLGREDASAEDTR